MSNAKLRSVNTRFWTDGYIVDLEPDVKLLFLYLLTNPLANIAGCYEVTLRQIVFDTGIKRANVEKSDPKARDGREDHLPEWLAISR